MKEEEEPDAWSGSSIWFMMDDERYLTSIMLVVTVLRDVVRRPM